MTSYQRPPIESPVFRDADGQVIDYGNRWGGVSPPEDTYSVETHPERFAPLAMVADALIAHLRETYDVVIGEGQRVAVDLLRPPFHDVVRAVRIRPNDPACASLTFVFTAYPGVVMRAGLVGEFPFPVCGCDACDSSWEAEAGELERQVLAVVAGSYRERIEQGSDPGSSTASPTPTGADAVGDPATFRQNGSRLHGRYSDGCRKGGLPGRSR